MGEPRKSLGEQRVSGTALGEHFRAGEDGIRVGGLGKGGAGQRGGASTLLTTLPGEWSLGCAPTGLYQGRRCTDCETGLGHQLGLIQRGCR